MRTTTNGQEIPAVNLQVALPGLPVYQRGGPVILLPLAAALISLTGLMSVPSASLIFRAALILLPVSLVGLFLLARRSLTRRKATTDFLTHHSGEFIAAAQDRYGVTLTETVLYSLAQGGSAAVLDSSGEIRRIWIRNDDKTTKLIAE